jgi:hypothetical protein
MMKTLLSFVLAVFALTASVAAQPATTTVPLSLIRSPCGADQLILGDLSCASIDALRAGGISTEETVAIIIAGWLALQIGTILIQRWNAIPRARGRRNVRRLAVRRKVRH